MSKIVRSKVESKSQQRVVDSTTQRSWCQRSFDQKLKANHNWTSLAICSSLVDVKDRSIKSWKQITTLAKDLLPPFMLMSKIVRSKVESKSQPIPRWKVRGHSWCQRAFDQKLKANHNRDKHIAVSQQVDVKDRSIKSWKQITTNGFAIVKRFVLMSKIVRSKVESKSQPVHAGVIYEISWCQRSFDQKLKANHNKWAAGATFMRLMSKIVRSKVESKSQQATSVLSARSCWCQRSFDQKLKANHN